MKRFRMLFGALAVAGLVAAPAFAVGKPIPFTASFAGKAVVVTSGDSAQITSAKATGRSKAFGLATLLGKGSGLKSDPCPLFGGPGSITTKLGKINFVITPTGGSACTDEQGQQFTLSGRATIKGGTAKYLKAKGTFKFAGSFDRTSGSFTVKFVGTLTV